MGRFLYERTRDYMLHYRNDSKVIWDIATVAFFVQPEAIWAEIIPAPVLEDDSSWRESAERHEFCFIRHIQRDPVFTDLFRRLKALC